MATPLFGNVISTDNLYLNYPFRVTITNNSNTDRVEIVGGFSNVVVPEVTYDVVEYRAGDGPLYRNRPLGLPTFNEISLQRGKLLGDVDKILDILEATNTYRNYRFTVMIEHYHPGGKTIIKAHNAVVSRIKVDGDLDSMSSDVSIIEIDFVYEYFTVSEVIYGSITPFANDWSVESGT